MTKFYICFLWLLLAIGCFGQATSISGIVNSYTPVTGINYCTNSVIVGSATAFTLGDEVLIIQMQGAIIDNTDGPTYGDILSYNNAGNFELATISAITGNDITFANTLLNIYDPTGTVQLVRVARYNNATVTGAVTCPPFNGGVGAVIAIDVANTLDLQAPIDASTGTPGGGTSPNLGNCHVQNYVVSATTGDGAGKGVGIAANNGTIAGKGKLANGGGGGNMHNAGGAGGGNFGTGGNGGDGCSGCCGTSTGTGGIGGAALDYSFGNKLFMGGSGGGGQQNNGQGLTGGMGGGIILIRAGQITAGAGAGLYSAGQTAQTLPAGSPASDGVGGGGSGGTIAISAASITGTPVFTWLTGGNGGYNYAGNDGAGGGGGGGAVLLSNASLQAGLNILDTGGLNGLTAPLGSPRNAQRGQDGGVLTNFVLQQSNTPWQLPVANQNVTICPNSSFILNNGTVVTQNGIYDDTTTSSGCTTHLRVTLAHANISIQATGDATLCKGQSSQLNATGGLNYSWKPRAGLNDSTVANPLATPDTTTTYVVSSLVPFGNLIVNGDFSAGNTGFSSSYAYTPPPNTAEGQYWVSTNAQTWNGGMASCGDHTSGSGNMLLVNGATTANISIYCQTVHVLPQTDYAFSTWLMTLTTGNPALLQFSINGNLLGNTFAANNATCIWQQFYNTWNSGTDSIANICIVNQNTQASANDFALDDISFAQICNATDTVIVQVNPVYHDTVRTAICQGGSYTLPNGTSVSTAGTYNTTLSSVHSCDSVVTTILTVNPVYSFTLNATICPNDNYTLPDGSTVSAAGTYVNHLTTITGCDSTFTTTISVVPNTLSAGSDVDICNGNSTQLNATGGLLNYSWTPITGLTNGNIANPVASPTQTTQYIVASQVASSNLIVNGDFSGGNSGFSSSYSYTSNLQPEATYYVGPNPNFYHPGFSGCADHTTGAGNMMIVNGSGTANTSVWCESISVLPNTNYAFICWGESVASGSPAQLQFRINGGLLGSVFTVPFATCQWQQFYAVWNSGANTTANICIINQNTATGGNDFALDDISFVGLCDVYDTVVVTVHNADTTIIDTSVCEGTVYGFPDGSTSSISDTNITHLSGYFGCDSMIVTHLNVIPIARTGLSPVICSGTTYAMPLGRMVNATGVYVDTLTGPSGCDSIVTVTLIVTPPLVTTVFDTICQGITFTLPSGIVVSAAGIYTDTLSGTGGCDSIVITNLAVNPTSNTTLNDTICSGAGFTLPNGQSVTTAGTYPVTLSNVYGCDSIVTTHLTVITVSVVAQKTDVTCNGQDNGTITAAANAGVGTYNFSISTSGSAVANNSSGAFTGLPPASYDVVATDNLGCSATTTVVINEPPPLLLSDSANDISCYGDNNGRVYVNATGGTPDYNFNIGNGDFTSGNFTGLTGGNYTCTVTDANGCVDSISASIHQPDAIAISIAPDTLTINLGQHIQLGVASNYDPTATYQWTPPYGLSCYDCPSPMVETNVSFTFKLKVSVNINGADCSKDTTVPITVIPNYDIFIPNSFTPNNDGNNDYFQIFGNLTAMKFVDVIVYDRIGEKVFESNNIYFKWDGNYKGQPLSPQVLTYALRAVFEDDHTEKIYKGTLTLLR